MTDQLTDIREPFWETRGATGSPAARPSWRSSLVHRELQIAGEQRPNAAALVIGDTVTTWAELDALANRGADGLLRAGARPGDVVGLQAANSPEALAMMFAIPRAGMIVLPLNPMSTDAEVAYQTAEAGARHVISPRGLSLTDLIASGNAVNPEVESSEDDPYWVRFTSGTTGRPRGFVWSHRAVVHLFDGIAVDLRYGHDDRLLVNGPLAHAAFAFAGSMIRARGSMHVVPFNADELWHQVEEHGITQMFAVPTMLGMAIDKPGTASTLRRIAVSGSTLPPTLRTKFAERFPHVGLTTLYGASELGMVTILHDTEASGRENSVGHASFGYQVRILDDEGNELPATEVGTVHVHGPAMCDRWIGSAANDRRPTIPGWVTAGDMGHLDENGFLFIADRRSDLIISGGLNVYPAEVENTLLQAPGVTQACVVGLPHEVWGQQVVAVFTGTASPADLDAHCRTLLAGYKIPRRYVRMEQFPLTPTGKVRRAAIREQLAEADSSSA